MSLNRFLGIALLMAATSSHAAYFCRGTINAIAVSPDGVVNVSSPSAGLNWVYLCQIGGSINDVSSDACKAIFAALVSAKADQRPVQWAFNDSLSCTTRPSWTYLTGWYWGPVILTE